MKHRFSMSMVAALFVASVLVFYGVPTSAAPTSAEDLGAAPTTADEVPQEIKDAFEDFKQQKFEDAVKKLDAARAKNPDLAPSELILAQWFSVINQPQALRQAIEVAVTKHPGDPEAFVILGELNLQNGGITEAELLFKQAEAVNAKFNESQKRKTEISRRILMGQAQVFAVRGKRPEAIARLNSILAVDPANVATLNLLGLIQFNEGNVQETLKAYEAVKKAQPETLLPEARVAMLYQQRGNEGDAAQSQTYMVAALNKAKQDPQVRIVATQWSLQRGNLKDAVSQSEFALRLAPDSADAQMLRGIVALYEQNYAVAETNFSKVLANSPSNFAATNNLALALCEQKDDAKLQRADEYALVNVRSFQKQPEAFSTRAWVLFKKGDYNGALQHIQRSLQLSNGNMSQDTAVYLASILDAIGGEENKKQATEIITKLLQNTKTLFPMKAQAQALARKLGVTTTP
ncbi:MAG: tetratricopeptide repeat protein [Planctomycetia bacterium]|nr:tetratricopeptide repeat protein [Planctomycetia bacterium]